MGGVQDFLMNLGQAVSGAQPQGIKLPGIAGAQGLPGVIGEAGAVMGGDEQGITVTGDGWNPRKPTFLGALADGYLMSQGMKPMFSIMRDQRNVNEAMEGFVSDPRKAISRMGRVRGQEGKAWDMYNQYVDNERADVQAESLAESRGAKFLPRIGGLLRSIQKAKDPNAAYVQSLPMLRRLMERAGGDLEGLPDVYDEEAVNNFIGMNVDPEDQIRMEALEQYREQRLAMQRQQEEGRNARFNTGQDRQDARTEMVQDRTDRRYNTPKPKAQAPGRKVVETERGLMILSPDGMEGIIGNMLWRKVAPGKWQEIGPVNKK